MSFFDAVASAFKRNLEFSGRSSRSEFWYFILFFILLYMLTFSLSINELDQFYEHDPEEFLSNSLNSLFGLAFILTLMPSISISVRRFHDINMSGWWYAVLQILPLILAKLIPIPKFISFISFMALLGYLYFMCKEGGGDNQYGSNPLQSKDNF